MPFYYSFFCPQLGQNAESTFIFCPQFLQSNSGSAATLGDVLAVN